MKAIRVAAPLALAASPALAHSAIDATTPPHIGHTFAKRIRLTRLGITHDGGNAVDLDPGGQTVFAVRSGLPLADKGRGVYRIEQRSLSGDGRPVHQPFAFQVQ